MSRFLAATLAYCITIILLPIAAIVSLFTGIIAFLKKANQVINDFLEDE